MTTSLKRPIPSAAPAGLARPVRIALADTRGRRARRRLASRLRGYRDRVEVVRRDHVEPDLVLIDPFTDDDATLDLTRLAEAAGDEPRVVVYTAAPAVDPLAFAMAGSVMDGRLRGWLSQDLSSDVLLDALERIHRGEVLVGAPPG